MRRSLLDSMRRQRRERRDAPERARDQEAIDRRLHKVQDTSTVLGWQSWRARAARIRELVQPSGD